VVARLCGVQSVEAVEEKGLTGASVGQVRELSVGRFVGSCSPLTAGCDGSGAASTPIHDSMWPIPDRLLALALRNKICQCLYHVS